MLYPIWNVIWEMRGLHLEAMRPRSKSLRRTTRGLPRKRAGAAEEPDQTSVGRVDLALRDWHHATGSETASAVGLVAHPDDSPSADVRDPPKGKGWRITSPICSRWRYLSPAETLGTK